MQTRAPAGKGQVGVSVQLLNLGLKPTLGDEGCRLRPVLRVAMQQINHDLRRRAFWHGVAADLSSLPPPFG